METVTHDLGRKYMFTGKKPAGSQAVGSSVPTRIVAQQGDRSEFPNLVIGAETYNEGDPAFASGLTVSGVEDLIDALTEGNAVPPPSVRAQIEAYRTQSMPCDPAGANRKMIFDAVKSSQKRSRLLVGSQLTDKYRFSNRTDPEMDAISSRYKIQSSTSPEAQAAVAFQSLKYEMAQCVTVELASQLDHHGDDLPQDHPARLSRGFSILNQLVTDLASEPDPSRGGVLLDHTTILAFSEFGRTPLINR